MIDTWSLTVCSDPLQTRRHHRKCSPPSCNLECPDDIPGLNKSINITWYKVLRIRGVSETACYTKKNAFFTTLILCFILFFVGQQVAEGKFITVLQHQ